MHGGLGPWASTHRRHTHTHKHAHTQRPHKLQFTQHELEAADASRAEEMASTLASIKQLEEALALAQASVDEAGRCVRVCVCLFGGWGWRCPAARRGARAVTGAGGRGRARPTARRLRPPAD